MVASWRERESEETVRLSKEAGGAGFFCKTDVSKASDVEALTKSAVDRYGRLDCAFNNARVRGAMVPTAGCTEEDWDQTVAIDLNGVWLCMNARSSKCLSKEAGPL